MPRRRSVNKIPTPEIQGKDSWIEFRSLRVKRIREIVKQREEATGYEAFELGMEVLAEILVGWNWADEEGNPLPQPKDDPAQIDDLTDEESNFLIGLFQQQTAEQAKNLRGRSLPRSG